MTKRDVCPVIAIPAAELGRTALARKTGIDCMQWNADEQALEAIKNDPEKAPLEDNERAMLKFVAKAIKTPDAVVRSDVEALHNAGWEDPDILDAVAHGAFMKGHATLMKAFSEKTID